MERGCCSSPRFPVARPHPASLPNALVPSSGGQGTVPDPRATCPISLTLAQYRLFKISPCRLAPNLKVFLSSVGVMCRCQHVCVCVTSCWWSALLAVDKLMMCSRPFFFFFLHSFEQTKGRKHGNIDRLSYLPHTPHWLLFHFWF